jgi:hypothetical protein
MPNTYTPIQSITVSGTTTSGITFSSIPQTYTDLVLVSWIAIRTSPGGYAYIRFNADSSASYNYVTMVATGATRTSAKTTGVTNLSIIRTGDTISRYASNETNIMNYSSTSTGKSILNRGTRVGLTEQSAGNFAKTTAITDIEVAPITGNFSDGCNFTLYGILSA